MTPFLNAFLTLNLLIIVLYTFCILARNLKASLRLKFQYIVLVMVLIFTGIQTFFPAPEFTKPLVRVWEGQTNGDLNVGASETTSREYMTLTAVTDEIRLETAAFYQVFCTLLFLFLFWTLIVVLKEIRLLNSMKKNAFLIKQFGFIRIYAHQKIDVPFSYWLPGKFNTFIPEHLLSDSESYRIAVLHEFQHHRQGDTRMLFVPMFIKAFCFMNPFAHLLQKEIAETQEFACDEKLLSKIDIDNYNRCLIQVAQTAVLPKVEPVCATGLCFDRGQKILKRRIQSMMTIKSGNTRFLFATLMFVSMLMMAMGSWAARNLVQDRKLSMAEAGELVKTQGEFPLVINQSVLTQLNRYLGTPEGRNFFQETLKRKANYEPILSTKTTEYGTPYDLNAIPIVESGFVNKRNEKGAKAGGIWMFIPSTAKRFGMRVTNKVDDRLNVEKETDAAQRYLTFNKELFNDWHLSVLAYNVGESAVKRGIKRFNTKDAFELVEKGVEGDKDYLPSVMAAMIIMRNPKLLD